MTQSSRGAVSYINRKAEKRLTDGTEKDKESRTTSEFCALIVGQLELAFRRPEEDSLELLEGVVLSRYSAPDTRRPVGFSFPGDAK